MEKITLNLKNKDSVCDVFAGRGLYPEIVKYVKEMNKSQNVIITDSKVEKLHGERLLNLLKEEGVASFMISFPEGEKNKTRQTKATMEDEMFSNKCGRDTLVIALGGGVTGDMAGFVAGTYMRGIPVLQIPTTTIAIGDSSYGGKTAIDVPAGKNLIGVFHQPIAVFMDTDLLQTLDERNYISGLVEIIKHGMIKDIDFYNFLKENIEIISRPKNEGYNEIMGQVVMRNLLIKRDVVLEDQRESNLRKILNYGHTLGHAVEKLSNFDLLHGEAIAIGIAAEAFFAYKAGVMPKEDYLEQKDILESIGLSTKIPEYISTKEILDLMRLDKKARGGMPEFSLCKKNGQYAIFENGEVAKRFSREELEKWINEYSAL
ncbi:3-dehydroquinate synthase [archaeon]|jgi:3-dehydroquinate synthase|nr:3-dehydroquinate synthase [archaeon]